MPLTGVWLRGRAGGCWGLLRHVYPTTHTHTHTSGLTPWCYGRSKGKGESPGPTGGGKNYLHTHTLSSNAFTWSRRKRRKELEELLSVPHPRYCSDFPQSSGGVVEESDDEAVVVVERGGEGEFDDTHHHRHHTIKDRDIGVRVNVGEPVVQELHRLFHIGRESALRMVRSEDFLLASDTAILHTLYYLKDLSIPADQLLRVPWILLCPADTLQLKFARLQEPHLFLSPADGLGFCRLSLKQVGHYQRRFENEATSFPQHNNRLYYLAHRLQVPVAVVTEKVVGPKQVLRMNINKVNHILDIFQRYGVRMGDVVSDMWVFCHNVKVTEERLRLAVAAGCQHPKPWICHSAPQPFARYLERLQCKAEVLGADGTLAAYMSERLQCTQYEVHTAFHRNASLRRAHVMHVKSKLDLLFSQGFTPEEVRSCMRVLQYSEARSRQRIQEMKSLAEFPFPISILFKRPKTYFNIVQRIKRRRKEEEEVEGRKRRGEGEE